AWLAGAHGAPRHPPRNGLRIGKGSLMEYRVILADDHPAVLQGVSLALTKDGLATIVGEAQSPDELLALLGEVPCDALITAFSMPAPGRDGLALLGEL